MHLNATNYGPDKSKQSWLRVHRRKFFVALGIALAAVAISCGTVSRTLVAPPHVPGAEYIGSEACAECHQETGRDFAHSTHARLKAPGENAKDIGCESCHGAG